MHTIFQKVSSFETRGARKCPKSQATAPTRRGKISEYWNKKSSSPNAPKCNLLAPRRDYPPTLPFSLSPCPSASHSTFKPAAQPVTIEESANLRRVSEWLAATLEMWCPARGCEFESRALRFENTADAKVTGPPDRNAASDHRKLGSRRDRPSARRRRRTRNLSGRRQCHRRGRRVDARHVRRRARLGRPRRVRRQRRDPHRRTGKTVAVDFDSRAPLAFREGLVTADRNRTTTAHARSPCPPSSPGSISFCASTAASRGTQASQPAIRLAEEGFEFDAEHQRHFARCEPHFDRAVDRQPVSWRRRAEHRRALAAAGPGELYAPAGGRRARRRFTRAQIAESIVRYLRDRGGILTMDDFRFYRPQVDAPIDANCREFTLHTPPPPSGGMTSLGIVQTVERFESR